VFDTVYYPEETMLIREARRQGCGVVTGVEMFVHNAASQFKLFTERESPLDWIRQELTRAIRPARQ
jgi:3-dehydroquinate dehydratase/shikimate dehydrogenase